MVAFCPTCNREGDVAISHASTLGEGSTVGVGDDSGIEV